MSGNLPDIGSLEILAAMSQQKPKIGIIGGSGFYEFLQGKEIEVATPFGLPSDKILIAPYLNQTIAFLPRHGKRHQYPPHKINYRANIFALKRLGVEAIIAPTAVGSLKSNIKPGNFVLCDQFIDRTKSRPDTFFDGEKTKIKNSAIFKKTAHISTAEPYCPVLRETAALACQKLNLPCHKQGTVIVIQGPRFSTKAESRVFSQIADVINMTQYPEIVLSKELQICYLNISLVTDYDAGLKDNPYIQPVSSQEVVLIFQQNTEKLKQLILSIIQSLPQNPACSCRSSLKNAFI